MGICLAKSSTSINLPVEDQMKSLEANEFINTNYYTKTEQFKRNSNSLIKSGSFSNEWSNNNDALLEIDDKLGLNSGRSSSNDQIDCLLVDKSESDDLDNENNDDDGFKDSDAIIREIDQLLSESNEMITPSPYNWQKKESLVDDHRHYSNYINDGYEINNRTSRSASNSDIFEDNLVHIQDELNDLSVKLDLSVKNGGQKMEMLTLSIHDQAQVSSLSSSQLNLHSTSNKSDTIDKQLPCSEQYDDAERLLIKSIESQLVDN